VPRAYEDEGAYKGKKMRKKGPRKVKIKEWTLKKNLAPKISKKCLENTRALIRP
jgi:hypothetical protein